MMGMLKRGLLGLAAGILALIALAGSGFAVDFEKEALAIRTDKGTVAFKVEIARSQEQRVQGLMFRRELAADTGMLFDYGYAQQISMWMKNTYIPLDMLFIRADGSIARIVERTTPHSLTAISSREDVRAVLELKGGTVDRLEIRENDRVEHPIFN